jgi:hypothetical protein
MKQNKKLINFRTPEALDDALRIGARNRGISKTALLNQLIYDFCQSDIEHNPTLADERKQKNHRLRRGLLSAIRHPLEYDPFK